MSTSVESQATHVFFVRLNYPLVLFFIVVVALVIRISVVAYFQGLNVVPDGEAQPDQLDYEAFAYQLSSGHGYTLPSGEPSARRPPGTSFVLAPIYMLVGRSYAAGRIWFCLLSAATCAAAFWVGTKLFDVRAGIISALCLAVTPAHFYYNLHFVSEVPYALTITVVVGLALTALDAGSRYGRLLSVLAGGVLGLAVLIRPQAILVIPIAWLMVVLAYRRIDRRVVERLLIVTLCFTLVVGSWMTRNFMVLGKPAVSTVAGPTFWGAHNEMVLQNPLLIGSWIPVSEMEKLGYSIPKDEVERDNVSWQKGKQFILEHWSDLPSLELKKLMRLSEVFLETPNLPVRWAFAVSWLVTAPFACLGLVVVLRKSVERGLVSALPLLAMIGTSLIFYGSLRFRHSTEPLLVVFAACGAVYLFDLMRGARAQIY